MRRALELAERGFPFTRPNPMVGAVLVLDQQVIAEGWHVRLGDAHAEVSCFQDAADKNIDPKKIAAATLYVTLEPCAHTGKTPPCVEAILRRGVKNIVVGTLDPNPIVNGKGVRALEQGGASVTVGVLENECRALNKRFFCFHEKKRPYIIFKWAQTADGFIARKDNSSKWISGEAARGLVHKWRDEESAIMVGTNTVIFDNPYLTSRVQGGRNPVRVLIDREQKIPTSFHVFDESATTLLYNESEDYSYGAAELIKIPFDDKLLSTVVSDLHQRGVQSMIIEGGAALINSFIKSDLWDEARIFITEKTFGSGILAPTLKPPAALQPAMTLGTEQDRLFVIERFS